MFRAAYWVLLAGVTSVLHGADQAWFTRAWSTDDGLPNNHVTGVVQNAAGELVVITRTGTAKFDGVHFTPVEPFKADPTAFKSLRAVTTAGEVWSVQGNTIGVERNGEFAPRLMRADPRIAAARQGGLWLAWGTNLAKITPEGVVVDCGQFVPNGPRPHVLALMEDRAGGVWIGTATNGLFHFDGETFQPIETSYAYILCITEDAEGNFWVGTDGGGLNRIAERSVTLERFAADASAVGIQSICEDSKGRLWGVTQNRWLVRREAGQWQRVPEEPLRRVDAPLCVAADRHGAVWIGTAVQALYRWQDDQLTRWGVADGLPSISVHSFLPASNGDLWIGGYHPDAVLRLRHDQIERLALPTPTGIVRALCEDHAGNFWIGADGGLFVAHAGESTLSPVAISDGNSERSVMSLIAAPDGGVWAGCAGGGLVGVQGDRVARVGVPEGLPDAYISQMVDDGLGWLWIGSGDHGIFKVRFDRLQRVQVEPGFRLRPITYGRNEGLTQLEAYGAHSPDAIGPSAIRASDGRIWMPMRTAMAVVQPKLLHEDDRILPVRVTRVAIDGVPAELPLHVKPSHRRIEFEFSILNLSTPENAHVRYRLDGIDLGWGEAGTQRVASYSRLAPGAYTFHLQSANFDGPWHDAIDPVAFEVPPFYWQTWWFRLSTLLTFTAMTAGIAHRMSTRRLRARHRVLEQQSTLDRERARIARDLHDDLGGSLTQVSVMLDLAKKDVPGVAQAKLGQCVDLVRGAAQSVDEIIWAINPRNDTLRFLIDYLSQFVVEYFHAANVECTIDLPDVLPDRPVTPETRHHLLLAVKECVTNISRHARATEVRFAVEADEVRVTLVLEDNGTGFVEAPDKPAADGLRNIRHRMTEIGGAFFIENRPDGGTRVRLVYRWLSSKAD